MNVLIPEYLNKNEVERQNLQLPVPVLFIPPSSEISEAKDAKHTTKIRINNETNERVSVFHGGVPEAYPHFFQTVQKSCQ